MHQLIARLASIARLQLKFGMVFERSESKQEGQEVGPEPLTGFGLKAVLVAYLQRFKKQIGTDIHENTMVKHCLMLWYHLIRHGFDHRRRHMLAPAGAGGGAGRCVIGRGGQGLKRFL